MTLPDVLSRGDSVRLSRLERKIADAMQSASKPIGEALLTIRDEKLYRATHKGFGQYVLDRWGFSRATAYRMMDQAQGLVPISPPENEKAQVNLSHAETKTTEEETTDDAGTASAPPIDPAPAQPPAGPPDPPAEVEAPSGATGDGEAEEEGDSGDDAPADILNTSSGEAELQPSPAGPTDEEPATLSRSASPDPISDADGLRWLNSKTAQQWRALGDPFGPGIRAKIKFIAAAFGFASDEQPERRQGYSRPAQPKAETNGHVDPHNCSHPKDRENRTGYGVFCTACQVKVR